MAKATARSDRTKSSRDEAKRLICEIVAAAGGRFHGKVRLNKAFYFAHLYHWRDEDSLLSPYPIARAPEGPVIDDCTKLLAELEADQRMEVSLEAVGPYQEYVLTLLDKDVHLDVASARGRAISQAVTFVLSMGAGEISAFTHEHSRSWQRTPNGGEMNIYADLLLEEELDSLRGEIEALKK